MFVLPQSDSPLAAQAQSPQHKQQQQQEQEQHVKLEHRQQERKSPRVQLQVPQLPVLHDQEELSTPCTGHKRLPQQVLQVRSNAPQQHPDSTGGRPAHLHAPCPPGVQAAPEQQLQLQLC